MVDCGRREPRVSDNRCDKVRLIVMLQNRRRAPGIATAVAVEIRREKAVFTR